MEFHLVVESRTVLVQVPITEYLSTNAEIGKRGGLLLCVSGNRPVKAALTRCTGFHVMG